MARNYYTLAVRESAAGYAPQFGDYDLFCVREERADMVDAKVGDYRDDGVKYKSADFKIVTSKDDQDSINRAIAALNAKAN